jgi:hypothetical protein
MRITVEASTQFEAKLVTPYLEKFKRGEEAGGVVSIVRVPEFKSPRKRGRAGDMTQVVEHVPSKQEGPGFIFQYHTHTYTKQFFK